MRRIVWTIAGFQYNPRRLFGRLLDSWAALVTRRRGVVLGIVGVFVAICAVNLPRLTTDTAPENLLISYGGYHERVQEFRRRFGDTDSVVAVLVVGADVLSLEALTYVHRLTNELGTEESVVRAVSITSVPVPAPADDPGSESLDDLGSLEDLEDLGDLDGGALPEDDPRFERALERLVASDPARFPLGMLTVADRVGGDRDIRPLIRPDAVPTAADVTRAEAVFEHAPLLRGRLVSGDRRVAAVVLVLDPALGTGEPRVRAVHALDERLRSLPPPAGIEVHPAGLPHLRAAISDAMIRDQIILVPLSLVICIVILLLSFRWVPGTLLPIVTAGLTVVATLGLMAIFGEPLTVLMNTVPTLLIVVGIAESVHILGRYIEESRRTADRALAARRTLRSLFVACFLAAFTTAVGFGALLVAQTEMLRRFGVVAALGVMIGFLLLMSFVPAALTYFAPPSRRKLRETPTRGWIEKTLVPLTGRLVRRRWLVLAIAALIGIAASSRIARLDVDTSLLDTFDAGDPVVESTRLVDEHLDGIRPLEVFVQADEEGRLRDPEVLAALDRVAEWAEGEPGVLRASSANDILHATWGRVAGLSDDDRTPFRTREQVEALATLLTRFEPSPLDDYLTPDGTGARVELRLGDVGAHRSIDIIHALEARLESELGALPGVRFSLLGEGYIGSLGVESVVDDLFGSLSLSAFVCFLTIALLFRSWRLGLVAIPTNVLPQLGTVAWMTIRGIPLDASTAVVFSVVIGVTVDLTIHGFARYLEGRDDGLLRRAALMRTARGTGRAMVVGTATLVLGFCALLFSGFVPIRHFGELIAVALFLSLAATLLLQPPLMFLFAPRGPGDARAPARAKTGD